MHSLGMKNRVRRDYYAIRDPICPIKVKEEERETCKDNGGFC